MSPDDPRYGRPAPIYTERPPGPPPVIYGDRPPGPQQPYYNDRASADPNAPRPPEGVAGAPGVTGSVTTGPDGRPMTVASLPPEEQPEAAPVQLAPNLRRQEVPFATKEPAGTIVVDTPNTYLYYVLGSGRAIRYGVRRAEDQEEDGVAGLVSANRDDRAPALSAALHGRWPG
jgi:hypothetical protein